MDRKPKAIIILDFDRTLFDTNTLKDKLIRVFISCGISKEEFFNSYELTKPYDISNHLKKMDLSSSKSSFILKKIRELQKISYKFIFIDSKPFLEYTIEDNFKTILLTYGSDNFQKSKIINSGLSKFFARTYVTQKPKRIIFENFANKHKNDKIFVIDDLKENTADIIKKFPKINIIKINRQNRGNSIKTSRHTNYFEVNNLINVKNIILNLI